MACARPLMLSGVVTAGSVTLASASAPRKRSLAASILAMTQANATRFASG
jgi:hypothetical protein